jgi:hypothetical protein
MRHQQESTKSYLDDPTGFVSRLGYLPDPDYLHSFYCTQLGMSRVACVGGASHVGARAPESTAGVSSELQGMNYHPPTRIRRTRCHTPLGSPPALRLGPGPRQDLLARFRLGPKAVFLTRQPRSARVQGLRTAFLHATLSMVIACLHDRIDAAASSTRWPLLLSSISTNIRIVRHQRSGRKGASST